MANKPGLSTIALMMTISLFGCDENYSYDTASYVDRGGYSGRASAGGDIENATLCMDINLNEQCDPGEPYAQSYADGRFSFAEQSNDAPILLQVKAGVTSINNQLAISNANFSGIANDNNPRISPFTTLVQSMLLFDASLNNETSKAIDLLAAANITGITAEVLQGADYQVDSESSIAASELLAAFTQANSLNNQVAYRSQAVVALKLLNTNTSLPVVTQADIDNLFLTGEQVSASISPAFSWQIDHADEILKSLTIQSGQVVLATKFHNRLILIDIDSDGQFSQAEAANFAWVAGERYELDATTGATEKSLISVTTGATDSQLIGAVLGKGLYLADRSNLVDKQQEVDHDLALSQLTQVAVNKQGTVAVSVSDNKKAYVTLINNNGFAETKISAVQTGRLKAVTVSNDGKYAWLASTAIDQGLLVLDTANAEVIASLDTGSERPYELLILNENLLAYRYESDYSVFLVDISDKQNPKAIKTIRASNKVKSLAVSPDGNLLLMGLSVNRVDVHNLSTIKSIDTTIETVTPPVAMQFIDNHTAVIGQAHQLQQVSLIITQE
ncbi:MAG: WD40 repeat domain-containing protein [Psychromonas sp.]|nr:WD40 repeat domain-containing protein [Alteromonadales bacterium]MCP5078454.1 WD40 repeat domain-containing protein [Psychromonas sp.]